MVYSEKADIPEVVEQLYHCWVSIPPAEAWPDYLPPDEPQLAYGLYAFRQGLRLGLRLADACREG